MEQTIALNGVGNARQLGGYRIGEKRIKDGVLLRTAGLNRITSDGLQALHDQYHVQTVIDLRMSIEQNALPDPAIEGAQNMHLPVVEIEDMMEGVDPKLIGMFDGIQQDRMKLFEIAYQYGFVDERIYVTFLLTERGQQAYRAFFDALLQAEEGRAVLWHCTDGKDRTGCAAMLTLFALGADRQTVLHDYLLTNTCNAQMLQMIRQKVAPLSFSPEKLKALIFMSGGVDEAHMTHAIDAIEQIYGSVMGYLSDALGLGDAEIRLLRQKYLTA